MRFYSHVVYPVFVSDEQKCLRRCVTSSRKSFRRRQISCFCTEIVVIVRFNIKDYRIRFERPGPRPCFYFSFHADLQSNFRRRERREKFFESEANSTPLIRKRKPTWLRTFSVPPSGCITRRWRISISCTRRDDESRNCVCDWCPFCVIANSQQIYCRRHGLPKTRFTIFVCYYKNRSL